VKQKVTVKNGVETELAKKIVKMIKTRQLKVTAAIQATSSASPAPSATRCRRRSRWCERA